ncbi:MAG: response regulator transcription factor, partial [Acutalibacteraceae bacterium]
MKMLIADDNRAIVDVLKRYAEDEGFQVMTAEDGETALALCQEQTFSMILLDVMMPGLDGFTVCRRIREQSMVPIIMITARGEDYERIMGLEIGADDYMVKPFVPAEVMARVKAILRRVDGGASRKKNIHTYAGLTVDLDTFSASIQGQAVPLTKKEIEILWILMRHPNQVFTRDHLLDSVWGYDYEGDIRTVDSHIKRLRAKLAHIAHPEWDIKTVWGVGYRFEVDA